LNRKHDNNGERTCISGKVELALRGHEGVRKGVKIKRRPSIRQKKKKFTSKKDQGLLKESF